MGRTRQFCLQNSNLIGAIPFLIPGRTWLLETLQNHWAVQILLLGISKEVGEN
jgi:hypothetical protein